MKKHGTIIVGMFLFIACGVQQSMAQVEAGVKAGLSIPNLTSGSSANPINSGYSSRLGPDFAVFAEFHLSPLLSIQPQLEYSSQGGKKNGNQAFTTPTQLSQRFPGGQVPQYLYADYKSVAKLNYLLLPILAKFNFRLGVHWLLYADAGPFAAILLDAKNITSGSSNVYLDEKHTQPVITDPNSQTPLVMSFDNTENIKSQLHTFNAGVEGSIGLACQLGRNKIFIEGGGNYGFINIQKGNTNGKNHTGAATIALGYACSFHKK